MLCPARRSHRPHEAARAQAASLRVSCEGEGNTAHGPSRPRAQWAMRCRAPCSWRVSTRPTGHSGFPKAKFKLVPVPCGHQGQSCLGGAAGAKTLWQEPNRPEGWLRKMTGKEASLVSPSHRQKALLPSLCSAPQVPTGHMQRAWLREQLTRPH